MPTAMEKLFVDIDYVQQSHKDEKICGDSVISNRIEDELRFILVLSDGLGHGVKANVLSTMTSVMALRFIEANYDIVRAAEIIMDTLPVCSERKISYSTFTIIDSLPYGKTRVIEMDNPPCIFLRNGKAVDLEYESITSPKHTDRTLRIYEFTAQNTDRLIIFSDGITQAGTGTKKFPSGFERSGCVDYVEEVVARHPDISATELAGTVLREAIAKEPNFLPSDDMTCAVFHFRYPKKIMIFTGAPFDRNRDSECAATLDNYPGTKVVSGGTTGEIVARELGRKLEVDLSTIGGSLPPTSTLDGIDLVTEGIYTLTQCARYLKEHSFDNKNDPAAKVAKLLVGHDVIDFLVGTRVNEAHQDPNLPVDLELRRNIVRRISNVLKDKYFKEVTIRFV